MIAQILRELIAAGLQGESLVAAVERIEQAQPDATDLTAERRRAKDRERYRLRKPPKSAETTETTEMASLTSSSFLPSLSEGPLQPIKEVRTVVVEGQKGKRALPKDWIPKQSHYEKAKSRGFSADYVDQRAEDLRDWAYGKDVRRSDWDRTFNQFLKPQGNQNGFGGPRPLQDDSKSISRAAGRLAERAARGEQIWGPRPSLVSRDDPNPVFLLSKGRST